MNKGIYHQMQEVKIEHYNDFTLEKLTQYVKDIYSNIMNKSQVESQVEYPELSKEDIKEYNKLIRKVKSGYLYQIGQEIIMLTGCEGAKNTLKKCKKENIPFLFKPDIRIIDEERNISTKLEDITWTKIKAQVKDKCSSKT